MGTCCGAVHVDGAHTFLVNTEAHWHGVARVWMLVITYWLCIMVLLGLCRLREVTQQKSIGIVVLTVSPTRSLLSSI